MLLLLLHPPTAQRQPKPPRPLGALVGVIVAASHNGAEDNGATNDGAKAVEGDGGMLYAAWEGVARAFVHTADGGEALAIVFGGRWGSDGERVGEGGCCRCRGCEGEWRVDV